MAYRPLLVASLLAACVGLTACAPAVPDSELPPLPRIDVTPFLPIIQDRLQEAQLAAQSSPRDADAVGQLGMLLHAHDQWEGAEQAYRRARLLAPRAPRWLYYHALALEALGRVGDAIDVLRFAVDEGLADTSMQIQLAMVLLEDNELEPARELLTRTLADAPDSGKGHFILARVLEQAGELEPARQHLERTLVVSGHFSPAYYLLGQIYRQTGNEAQAQKMLELSEQYRGVQGRDDDPLLAEVTKLNLSDLPLIARAEVAARLGRPAVALDLLNEAVRRNPQSLAAHTTLVGLYGVRKQFDLAEKHYEAARTIDPQNSKLQYNLGLVRLSQGRREEASEAFLRTIELDASDANPHVQLGLIDTQSGRFDDAMTHYRRALAIQPQDRQANWLLGYVLVERGEHAEALEHLALARGLSDPVTPLVLESMARAYRGLGNVAAARAALEEALKIAGTLNDATLGQRLSTALRELERSAREPSDAR
ncbi:MAG: tetratricopeptide repeat protein [bacterium]|nr:tetratricopeptide repeat protein [bacterium]